MTDALKYITDESIRNLIKQRLAFGENREKEIYAKLEDLDQKSSLKLIKANMDHHEAMSQQALELAAKAVQEPDFAGFEDDPAGSKLAIPVNPKVYSMTLNVLLSPAASILTAREHSSSKLDVASSNAQQAYAFAKKLGAKSMVARCRFYTALVALRQGSIKTAKSQFQDALEASPDYVEGKWAHEWLKECEKIIAVRGDASRGSSPSRSPPTSGATRGKSLPSPHTPEGQGKGKARSSVKGATPSPSNSLSTPEKIDSGQPTPPKSARKATKEERKSGKKDKAAAPKSGQKQAKKVSPKKDWANANIPRSSERVVEEPSLNTNLLASFISLSDRPDTVEPSRRRERGPFDGNFVASGSSGPA